MFALRNRYLLGKQILNYVGQVSIEHKFYWLSAVMLSIFLFALPGAR